VWQNRFANNEKVGLMGMELRSWARGLGRGVTEEFDVKVLKFEIMNSWNLFDDSSRAVVRTIETVHPVMLSPGQSRCF
jgi:hypothetical protein